MTAPDDLDRQLNDFLRDGPDELPFGSLDAMRDRTEQTDQRVVIGPWRLTEMNKIVTISFGAAVVVVAAFVGAQLFGSSGGGQGFPATPTPSVAAGLPEGPYLLSEGTDGGVSVTVTIAAPLWQPGLCWGDPADTCAGPPDGAGLVAFQSREYHVYADACHRPSGVGPDTTATTVDELVDALANQVHRRVSTSIEDISLDGYAGKRIILNMAHQGGVYHPVGCDDDNTFALFGLPGDDLARYSQGERQIEELWIVDVNGMIVVLDGAYYPDTAPGVVDELRAILASATFELP
jgi:hypothetical protein